MAGSPTFPGGITMNLTMVLSIAAAVAWVAPESYLIVRDKGRDRGTTAMDRQTRFYNIVATEAALVLCLLGSLHGLGFGGIPSRALMWIGVVVACAGFALRHWSIHVLGRYFRTTVELDADHRVVQSGPYRYVRHPSYDGIIMFFVGYGLLAQNWISLVVALALPTLALIYRMEVEERALVQALGSEYSVYQTRTKRLIPGIW